MTISAVDGRATWPFEPFYEFLHTTLPEWHRADGTLDVPQLASTIGVTAEAVYKWLRKGKFPTAGRARQVFELASRESNAARLPVAPDMSTFYTFTA